MEVSVVITNYNYGKFLPRAIRSVLDQNFDKSNYEIIVIDDFSSDNSRELLNPFTGLVRCIYNDRNIGLAASCNKAIKAALGRYVVRLDADDYVSRDWINVHHLFLSANKDMDATSSDYLDVDLNENVMGRRNGVTWPIACGIMFRVEHMFDIGLYDESLPREDVDFRCRFLQKYRIYNIPIPLYRYSSHNESKTKNETLSLK